MEKSEDLTTQMDSKEITKLTWNDLGLADWLCEACQDQKWKLPTKIQREAIPQSLQGKDIIGLAETGSGKTAAFALPILQELKDSPQYYKGYFALILTPTRELAFQISEQFESLGASIKVKCAVIVGGMDMMAQTLMLRQKPHIIIATPGRLVDHLENTKAFNLNSFKYLVMDEADRMLNVEFNITLEKILNKFPKERRTMLFSATMTSKVEMLQKASLRNPVKVEAAKNYQTVDKLKQYYIFVPNNAKNIYLVYLLNKMAGNTFMIFCSTCNATMKMTFMLKALHFKVEPLHGKMSQAKRLAALENFKEQKKTILIATDVASRGLDIPHVDVVINYDVPDESENYIHRVGRTARAGRSGIAITMVWAYDIEIFQRLENLIAKKLPEYPTDKDQVEKFRDSIDRAERTALSKLKDLEDSRKSGKRKKHQDEENEEDGEQLSDNRKKEKFNGKIKHQQHRRFNKKKK